ncbi:hypothetical protein SORBI_3008G102900 [Sorghum bicolor]|uniref:Uncharacterized protein n=1 Tax=Sorghum bicolor TaxID=4558 RepID=C5YNW6_SORBI|nr:hypothetical protein SORBI_3008G102900 [Sorghum bicolor]
MAAAASRKLVKAPGLAAAVGLGFGPGSSAAGDDAVPWDVVEQKLAELLRFLASAVQAAAVAVLREHAARSSPRWARWCGLRSLPRRLWRWCSSSCAAQRRRRGPDGEEVEGLGGDVDADGPVVRYRGIYKGGIFSMHPNKPIVC